MKSSLNHIAIIQDGNRRWAKSHSMLLWEGHKYGVSNFRKITNYAFEKGIQYLTFWALSIDNLEKRSKNEIKNLFKYIKDELKDKETINNFLDQDIRVRVVGKWRELIDDEDLNKVIENLELKTKDCKKFNLTILFVYDGKTEMIEAIKEIKTPIDYEIIKNSLWTHFLPPVDLVIRTGGEPHWSGGFMMWLVADSQLYFTETKWPDFDKKEFDKVLDTYSKQERRFGK